MVNAGPMARVHSVPNSWMKRFSITYEPSFSVLASGFRGGFNAWSLRQEAIRGVGRCNRRIAHAPRVVIQRLIQLAVDLREDLREALERREVHAGLERVEEDLGHIRWY